MSYCTVGGLCTSKSVQTVLGHLAEGGLTRSMFSNQPLPSFFYTKDPALEGHSKLGPDWGDFSTCFALSVWKHVGRLQATRRRVDITEGSCQFSFMWHAHELEDMFGVFKMKCFCSVFFVLVSMLRSLNVCVCVCVFCIPIGVASLKQYRGKMYIPGIIVKSQRRLGHLSLFSYRFPLSVFIYKELNAFHSVVLECPLFTPEANRSVNIDVWTR